MIVNLLVVNTFMVASGGKQVPAAAFKSKDAPPATLDYTDIPHSQIRKVVFYFYTYLNQSS